MQPTYLLQKYRYQKHPHRITVYPRKTHLTPGEFHLLPRTFFVKIDKKTDRESTVYRTHWSTCVSGDPPSPKVLQRSSTWPRVTWCISFLHWLSCDQYSISRGPPRHLSASFCFSKTCFLLTILPMSTLRVGWPPSSRKVN